MRTFWEYDAEHPGRAIYKGLLLFAVVLIAYGFASDAPINVLRGIWTIIRTQAGLITDSMMVGGIGAAFANAGLVTLLSVVLIRACGITFSGVSIACVFLMAGFSLFGKDVCNILPIILGGFLYSLYRKERFGRYLYISLFGTALSPLITEISLAGIGSSMLMRFLFPVLLGVLVGFLLPPVAAYAVRAHQGYNLYNVGFAAGLIGMVLASFLRSFGYQFKERLEWSVGNNLRFASFLLVLFGAMLFMGFWLNGRSFTGIWAITRHSGRAVADFVMHDGYPVVLMNMAMVGTAAMVYVLAVGGELNGPTIGGIFTIVGFGAFGKHIKNCAPVVLGVVVSSFAMVWNLSDPAVLLAALFSTCLAPIAGQYGWLWGMLAGAMHASVVLNVGILHGGLNLYNNGFSGGLICMVLIPLIESMRHNKPE